MDYCPTQGGTFRAYPPFTAATVAKPRPAADAG